MPSKGYGLIQQMTTRVALSHQNRKQKGEDWGGQGWGGIIIPEVSIETPFKT